MAANPMDVDSGATEETAHEALPNDEPAPEDVAPLELSGELPSNSAQLVLVTLAAIAACYAAKLPLIVLCVSILLSFVLAPLVDVLQRLHLPRPVGALIASLVFLAVLFVLGMVSYNSGIDFAHQLPKYSGEIKEKLGKLRQQANEIQKSTETVLPNEPESSAPTVKIAQQTSWLDSLTSNLGGVTEIAVMASFVPFLSFFMLSWQDHVRSATVMLFRMENRNTAYVTLGLISSMIRSFIVGNVLVGLFMGGLGTIIFGVLGLPYFYFIGFISGFLSLVPYLGVVLAVLPPLIAGLGHVHSAGMLGIVITVVGLHLFSLNVLYPKFLGSRLQLNPLAVTLALLFWGWLWGAMGLVLAVPMTAAAKIVFDHIEHLRGWGTWLGE